jgi:hypothetical protein
MCAPGIICTGWITHVTAIGIGIACDECMGGDDSWRRLMLFRCGAIRTRLAENNKELRGDPAKHDKEFTRLLGDHLLNAQGLL